MKTDYESAIAGTLKSPGTGAPVTSFNIVNKTPMTLLLFFVGKDGAPVPVATRVAGRQVTKYFDLKPNAGVELGAPSEVRVGDYIVAKSMATGAFVCVVKVGGPTQRTEIDFRALTGPNDIGATPAPSKTQIIPADSGAVMVGYAVLPNKNVISREQYWRRRPDSYSLAAYEKKVIGYTVKTGREATSSETNTVASMVGTSASAGWGPISASVSANLSRSSTSFQQLTISEQTTSDFTDSLDNSANNYDVLVFHWQLMDIINLFDIRTYPRKGLTQVAAQIVTAEDPTLTRTYRVSQLRAATSLRDRSLPSLAQHANRPPVVLSTLAARGVARSMHPGRRRRRNYQT